MGPWQILGEALLAPLKRVDLIARYFWKFLIISAIGYAGFVAAIYLSFSSSKEMAIHLHADPIPFDLFLALLPLGMVLMIVAMLAAIAFIVEGLVKWHRHYALSEADGGSKADRSGRGWRMFGQLIVVGWGFLGILMLLHVLIVLPIYFAIIGDPILALDPNNAAGEIKHLQSFLDLVGLAVLALATVLFAMIFKRRSVRLAFVAADARQAVLPQLARFNVENGSPTCMIAASLALPIGLISLLHLGAGHFFDFHDFQRALALQKNIASIKLETVLTYILYVAFLCLLLTFYPMLVFATTVSLYYLEHIREPLLASLAEDAPVDQAASAP